jgi:hypothetical protein
LSGKYYVKTSSQIVSKLSWPAEFFDTTIGGWQEKWLERFDSKGLTR